MSQTIHDAIQAALIKKAVEENDFEVYNPDWPEPEKYRRMWKKITGRDITLEEAEKAIKESEAKE